MSDHTPQGERLFAGPLALVRILSLDEVTDAARKKAPDPAIFESRQPFVWRAEASNTRLDAYFTHMSIRTLRNFAEDAENGVSFQNSHRTFEMPIGRSIAGQFVNAGGNSIARMVADFFTLPGLNLNGLPTDDFIAAVRAGIVKDVSVGFSKGQLICDIDGENYITGECRHILGFDYPVEGSNKGQRVTATGEWDDCRLHEVSQVFEGATPGAEIIAVKAQQEADAGRMTPETARFLESRYQIRIKGAQPMWGGATLALPSSNATVTVATTTKNGERVTPYVQWLTDDGHFRIPVDPKWAPNIDPPVFYGDEQRQADPAPQTPAAEEDRIMPPEANGTPEQAPITDEQRELMRVGAHVTDLYVRRTLVQDGETVSDAAVRLADEVTRLRPLADMGTRYKADLIEAALKEGVRAMGSDFPKETYRPMLERSSIDEIQRFTADWAAMAARDFKPGRSTVEGEQEPKTPDTNRYSVPNAAFRA